MADDVNPWSPDSFNLTAQSAYVKKYGPERAAARMRDAKSSMPVLNAMPSPPRVYILQGRQGPPGASALRAPILGFTAEGPFTARERFALAPSGQGVRFPAALAALSSATCQFAPLADSSFILTATPDDYLANGSGVICTVTYPASSQIGSFAWNSITLAAPARLYVLAPLVADANLGGVQILFRGDPA